MATAFPDIKVPFEFHKVDCICVVGNVRRYMCVVHYVISNITSPDSKDYC